MTSILIKNRKGEMVEVPPKDEEELMLEKLVFGDIEGLQNSLKRVDNIFDFDDDDAEGGEEVIEDEEDSDSGDDDLVQDEDLFYIDDGEEKDVEDDGDEDMEDGETSGEGGDSEDEGDHDDYDDDDEMAWVDSDDEKLNISLIASDRLKKLRRHPDDVCISGKAYTTRLRSQFEKIYPRPEWVNKFEQQLKEAGDSDDEDRDDDNDVDMDQDDESLKKQMTPATLSKLLSTTHQFLASKQLKLISPTRISITRLKDANYQKISKSAIQALSFHPTHSILLTAGFDKTIRLYQIDGKTNNYMTSYFLKNCPIMACQFSPQPEQNLVYAAGRRKYMNKINLNTGEVEKISRMYGHEQVQKSFESMKLSPGGKFIGMIGNSGWFNLVNGTTGQWIKGFKIEGTVVDFDFAQDESFVVVINSAGEVWEFEITGKLTSKLENKVLRKWADDGGVGITRVKLGGRNSRWLAIGSNNGIVNLYDRSTFKDTAESTLNPKPFKTVENLVTSISSLLFNPDGQLLAIASRAKRDAFKLVHMPSGSVYSNWPTSGTPLGKVTSIVFSPNNEMLAVGNEAGKVTLWRLNHY